MCVYLCSVCGGLCVCVTVIYDEGMVMFCDVCGEGVRREGANGILGNTFSKSSLCCP